MKKKFMSLIALFLLILPLTACGEDNNSVEVNFSLEKQDTGGAAADFTLSDCAEISGGGRYAKGDSVVLTVRYVDAACKFGGFKIVETNQLLTNGTLSIVDGTDNLIRQMTYTLNNVQESRSVKAIIIGKSGELSTNGIEFQGVDRVDEKNGVRKAVDNYKFPIQSNNSNDNMAAITEGYHEIKQKTTLLELLSRGKNLDLNYVYVDNKFVPYKLKWEIGTYNTNDSGDVNCNYSSKEDIPDPQSYELLGNSKLCVRASYHTYEETQEEVLKNTALNKMLTSPVIVFVGSQDACEISANGDIKFDQDCFYVSNLKNLYNSKLHNNSTETDKKKAGSKYYGINNHSQQESVYTESATGNKYYSVCVSGPSSCTGTAGEAGRIVYSDLDENAYKLLDSKVVKLIEALKTNKSNDTYSIPFDDVELVYNTSADLNTVVPFKLKVDGINYYIRFAGEHMIPAILQTSPLHDKYTINFTNTFPQNITMQEVKDLKAALEELKKIVDSKVSNTLFTKGANLSALTTAVRTKFLQWIEQDISSKQKDSKLHILKDYTFVLFSCSTINI